MVSSIYTVNGFLLNHIDKLSAHNEVTVIANTRNKDFVKDLRINYELLHVRIERRTHPLYDLFALVVLVRLFKRRHFDIVHSVTPKAGLLAMTAARIARVQFRIHTFTGQVWVTRSRIMRWILKQADTALALSATNILVDSSSQLDFLLHEKVVSANKAEVLASGSINGVDTSRFIPDPQERVKIRAKNNIPDDAILFLFLGRLNGDKGLIDLSKAFTILCAHYDDVFLIIVGRDEENLTPSILKQVSAYAKRVHILDHTLHPERFMAASDVLCLPSFREGFSTVIIEAASTGIPSIGSRIYGITDAIVEGETGMMHEAGNIHELYQCMIHLYDHDSRKAMGDKARKRVIEKFSQDRISSALIEYYRSLGL